jgi:putative Holliday junction resolvase
LRRKFSLDVAVLLAQLEKDNVGAIALGLPVNMDGSEGPRAQKSRAFVRNMAAMSDLPFVLWDERLSTVAAERTLIEMDFSRRKRAGKIDSAAAAFILQGVLDRLQSLGSGAPAEPGSPIDS